MPPPLPFDEQFLRGVTVRSALWIIGGLTTILASVIMTYASIMHKLDRHQEAVVEMKRGKELLDVQIKTIEVQLQTMEIRLVRLETQVKTK